MSSKIDSSIRFRRFKKNLAPRMATLLLAFLPIALGYGAAETRQQAQRLVFMTDFGLLDDSVPICKGVMYSIDPDLRIVDLTHQVTPYSILDGARYLFGATPYYPAGTVFVVVVDPTVGSTRKAVVVKSRRGQYFVLPDNGLITLVAERDGLEDAREITNRDWMIGSALSSTFHGRDIFSPVGAHLARGDDWTQVGPEIPPDKLVRLDLQPVRTDDSGIHGAVIATDGPFGNLVTNVDGAEFLKLGYHHGDNLRVTVGTTELELTFARTFSDVPLNTRLLYIDSRGRVGLAMNQGSFAFTYRIKLPAPFLIARPKPYKTEQ